MKMLDIFEKKDFADKYDVMICFDCGKDKAGSIIRAIKYKSDIAHFAGRVTLKDYLVWSGMSAEVKA